MSVLEDYDREHHKQIIEWLGTQNPDKVGLVRLLLARLTWNWKDYEEYQRGGEYIEIESQVCRIDICHYTFPKHLDSLLQGIGTMKPIKNFEGCGTFSPEIKKYFDNQYSILCTFLKSKSCDNRRPKKTELIKLWLIACLAKTLKEQVGLTKPIPELSNLG